ncbi:MAG: alpha/beta fold hydrolase [Clostridia bacterium]|nr:alpha/beta fold hydrolase [Clostridia bacterium]
MTDEGLAILFYKGTYMNKSRKTYIASCEISEVTTVNLGGYDQKIAIEGRSKTLPLVICLHGGPGSPVPFSVGCRGLFPDLTDKAIMVYWDQLGCGINNFKLTDDFTISNFVDMTCDLVKYLRARFPQNKLYIFAVSWGSMLSLGAVNKLQGGVDGVLVWGQIVKDLIFNEEVYTALRSAPEKVKKEVEQIKKTGKNGELNVSVPKMMKFVDKYTDGRTSHTEKGLPVGEIIKGLLTGPDYKFRDFKAIMNNGYRGNKSLWKELVEIDLSQEFGKVTVPYKILQGENDLITPTAPLKAALEGNKNTFVTYKPVPKTGHMPTEAAMKTIFNEIYEMGYGAQ